MADMAETRLKPDDLSSFMMPWEHYVCSECYQENPYAIWLVKQCCFKPHRHQGIPIDQVLVVVDRECMAMVPIRLLPQLYSRFKGPFIQCPHHTSVGAQYNLKCRYAHGKIEFDTWNIKKRMINANLILVREIISADVQSQSPSKVCDVCYKNNPSAIWLAWLKCIYPDDHNQKNTVAVLINSSQTRLVQVRQPPVNITNPNELKLCSQADCQAGNGCVLAHSTEEFNYWKRQAIKRLYNDLDGKFQALCTRYEYPTEASIEGSLKGTKLNVTPQIYKSKYHKLVHLDELAHSRKMAQECDGCVDIEVPAIREQDFQNLLEPTCVLLVGMSGTAMDYAAHNFAQVELTVVNSKYTAKVIGEDEETNALVVEMHSFNFFRKFNGRVVQLVPAHFDIDHKYRHYSFQRMHQAIECADPVVIQKLLPKGNSLTKNTSSEVTLRGKTLAGFTLDQEYQRTALKQMLSCNPSAPYLVLGPFGTGKTHLLAAAVANLSENPHNKVLVCTHMNIGADNLYNNIQEFAPIVSRKALRLAPSEKVAQQLQVRSRYIQSLDQVNPHSLIQWPIIVTTFGAAFTMKGIMDAAQVQPPFTHILIDEGAQSREPEALGALLLANESVKLIIVGDNQQVGPQVKVLSHTARENGLGTSLIERLFKHYKYTKQSAIKSHTTTLLTNYRSHPSILMLASSLFYECTLLSRSDSKTHPKAPYPILFACTSINSEVDSFCNLPAENHKEANILVQNMMEYIRNWPTEWSSVHKPTIGLLASTRKQVGVLRQKFREKVGNPKMLPCKVEILTTYNIQGEEFTAVFLSTCEPTDTTGQPGDSIRSICNEYVFNTLITRARSLIFTAGNPFLLQHMGKNHDINCWIEYIQRCIHCQTLFYPELLESEVCRLPKTAEQLFKQVFSNTGTLQQATQLSLEDTYIDTIVQQYISDLQKRNEFKFATKLVQDSSGEMRWESETDAATRPGTLVWCRLDCKNYRSVTAIPTDPSKPHIKMDGLASRRLGFHGDVVKVDTINKCVLLDEETEQAICKTHFGASFLCRVDPKNPIMFCPLDIKHPKFVNLPSLTRRKDGVICFDPKSLNSIPKTNNFIPLKCAVKMLFVVKFLGWRKNFHYPLGIIVGALPCGNSRTTGDMVLRIAHNIPLTLELVFSDCPAPSQPVFTDAFTIDPQGSTDHDDALTCKLLKKKGNIEEYQVGVHITNVQQCIGKDSELDKQAFQIGCSAYSAPDKCVSKMVPESVVNACSLMEHKPQNVFSVLAQVTFKKGAIHAVHNITITENTINSKLELTYREAQSIIDNSTMDHHLTAKVAHYDQSCDQLHGALTITKQLEILWKAASFLRQQRLGKGAYCFLIDEPDRELYPEAHYLIEELMIWANENVGKKLLENFPDSTILRTQDAPNESELQSIIEVHGPLMAASLALRSYVPQNHRQLQGESLHILQTSLTQIQEKIQSGSIKQALHCIQFEHLHPQFAAVHSCFRQIQSSSSYIVSTIQQKNYWHDTLKCKSYTHFTSPIRRYIDIVIQRQLHAALSKQNNPYSKDELENISIRCKEAARRARNYERDVNRLLLANTFQQSSKQFLAIVMRVEEGDLHFCFPDLSLKKYYSREAVHLKTLDATMISQQTKPIVSAARPLDHKSSQTVPLSMLEASWKAKICSFLGSCQIFLKNDLQLCSSDTTKEKVEIILFVPELGNEANQTSHLIEKKLSAVISPSTCPIPLHIWGEAQSWLEKDPKSLNPEVLLKKFRPSQQVHTTVTNPVFPDSPLWIYKVCRSLQACEVMKVQLCGSLVQERRNFMMLTPQVQLLEVAPELRICIQHNSSPAECFTDKPTQSASKERYWNLKEYFGKWEKVLLAEAAHNSLTDSELLIIKDVTLNWPKLSREIDSSGQVYYQLPMRADRNERCVCVEPPKRFMNSSYDFFKFTQGDLVCVRCNTTEENGDDIRCVFHMVVDSVDLQFEEQSTQGRKATKARVYLKFVSERSNYVSCRVEKFLQQGLRSLPCEVQLIPLILPYRRIYQSLCALRSGKSTGLATAICLGRARIEKLNPCNISVLLSQEVALIATSVWPLQHRSCGRGRVKLNKFQRKAVDVVCSNTFSMIQGPPGTGKTITGTHLAYALAMKLRRDIQQSTIPACEDTIPCVMYCGPSQRSVDVALERLVLCESLLKKSPLKIIRVYSKDIERNDYQGPKQNSELFHQIRDSRCDPKYRNYALHHIVHERNPEISAMECTFEQYNREGKIPSNVERSSYYSALSEAESAILKDGIDIVLCTCNEASSHRMMKNIKPVYCIVDECAMATEPECMVPIRRAEHVVLIGDHMQLQPVIQYRDAADMGLNVSLFERYVKMNVQPHMLEVQYRMHLAICRFPSREFYNEKLKTDSEVAKKREKEVTSLKEFWPQKGIPLVFCDIIGSEGVHIGQKGKARVGIESKYNEKEARKIVQIYRVLTEVHNVHPNEIAVLTPYSAQKVEIKRIAEKQEIIGVEVKTITESQGSEYGIVLLSMVRSRKLEDIRTSEGGKKKADIGWIRTNLGFVTDKHQICVAITRCKYGLVIVGNKVLLSYDDTWDHLIKHYHAQGCILRGGQFPV